MSDLRSALVNPSALTLTTPEASDSLGMWLLEVKCGGDESQFIAFKSREALDEFAMGIFGLSNRLAETNESEGTRWLFGRDTP